MRIFLAVISCVSLAACSQDYHQATVYQKGHYFYGHDSIQKASYTTQEVAGHYKPNPYSPDFRAANGKVDFYAQPNASRADAQTYAPAPVTTVTSAAITPIQSQDIAAPQAKSQNAPIELKRYYSKDVGKYEFIKPVQGSVVSGYGKRANGAVNDGINYLLPAGEPVFASAGGEVVYVGEELKGYGKMAIIKHHGGYNSSYAHLGQTAVAKGEKVKQGHIIGYSGQTGNVDKPQLHFAIRKGADPVDPDSLLMKSMASK